MKLKEEITVLMKTQKKNLLMNLLIPLNHTEHLHIRSLFSNGGHGIF